MSTGVRPLLLALALATTACSPAAGGHHGDGGTNTSTPDAPPVAVASVSPASGRVPLTATFDAAGSTPASATFTWTFDDGTTASGATVTRQFLGSGDHTATLTVETGAGADEADASVHVDPELCPTTGPAEQTGSVTDDRILEASGLAASRAHPGVLWTHNDNPDPSRLFALDATGAVLGVYTFDAADFDDAEDLAVGVDPGSGASVLYVGDIGNNDHDLTEVHIFVVAEPEVALDQAYVEASGAVFADMTVRYPNDAMLNAEALAADPVTGDRFVVTKDYGGDTYVYRKPAPHRDGDDVVLEEVAHFDFTSEELYGGAVTSADISPLGDQLVIRTYKVTAFVWLRDGGQTFAEALGGVACPITLATEKQPESVTYAPDGSGLWTLPEGALPPVDFTPLLAGAER